MSNHRNILSFVLLTLAAVMGVAGSGSTAAAQSPAAPTTERTGGEAVGASVFHPAKWSVEREQYTYDATYGYTLWRPDTGEAHDHGGTPALRVALAYDMKPQEIEEKVRDIVADYPDLPMKRETVEVAREHEGVAVGTIPGSTPATRVYVPVNGRVYRIEVYASRTGGEGLNAEDREVLRTLRFETPSRSIRSLDVPAANSPEALYKEGDSELAALERSALDAKRDQVATSQPRAETGEQRIAEGCWRAPSSFFVQVQHGRYASRASGDGIPTGYSRAGRPNYWGQYTHGNLGYGRCNEPDWTNDKFAIDYRLNRGDFLYSPFDCGRVTFAGRNTTHRDYGIFVVVRSCNGKYASMSAHLDAINRKVLTNPSVNQNRVIGYAGDTGGPDIPVGPVHLHQAFYRYPTYHRDGSPYGGTGLQVTRMRFFRGEGGTHVFGWERSKGVKAEGSLVVN